MFFEPSCLSAIREDAPSLLRGDAAAPRSQRSRTGRCCSRSCSKRVLAVGRACGSTSSRARRAILLHGHCHQKAMGRLAPARKRCSRRIPGVDGRRSRCRLLRHGRIVRLHRATLRGVAGDRRAAAAAGGARARRGCGAGGERHLVPAAGAPTSPACERCMPRSSCDSLTDVECHMKSCPCLDLGDL